MSLKNLNYVNFSQEELQELFTSAKQGNSNAFSELSGYVRHISYSYFFSKLKKGKIKNKEDVDDLSNNVYISFAEQYHKIENLEFWLRRVLFLNFVNWYKKNASQKSVELNEAHHISSKDTNPGDTVDAQKIMKLINTLSEDKQKVLKMRFWEDLKFSEIAEQMGKSEDAVKKIFYRSIKEIKNII